MSQRNVISLSSGKDSTALACLAVATEQPNQSFVFADTGNEHQMVYDHLEYLQDRLGINIQVVKANFNKEIQRKREKLLAGKLPGWTDAAIEQALEVLHPTGNPFLDLCLWKGRFPSMTVRFCTQFLKTEPIQWQVFSPLLAAGERVWSWQGIRRDESQNRRHALEYEEITPNFSIYRPIVKWDVNAVFEAHRYMGVEPNPLYKLGFDRVGCMPCINAGKLELRELALRFPEEIDRLRKWEYLVSMAARRGSATMFTATDDPTVIATDQIHYTTHGIDRRIEWAKTTRGGRMLDLLVASADPAECRSSYGLCEAVS